MKILDQHFEHNGYIKHRWGKTFYRRVLAAKPNAKALPLICLHGGPGSTHWSVHNMIGFSQVRDVIFYDQIGCGFSDPLRKSQMKTSTFVEELNAVTLALGLKRFHLLGHSWGTMLALDYYLKYPKRIASIIFSSPCVSISMWQKDAGTLIKLLPKKVQNVIYGHQKNKTTNSDAYRDAMKVFYNRFVFGKFKPTPHRFVYQALRSQEVYSTMWGPSEFCASGNLRSYENYRQLPKIQIPTLFTCGKSDEATPKSTQAFATLVSNSQFHVFKKSAHVPHNSETQEYLRVIGQFLTRNDDESTKRL